MEMIDLEGREPKITSNGACIILISMFSFYLDCVFAHLNWISGNKTLFSVVAYFMTTDLTAFPDFKLI